MQRRRLGVKRPYPCRQRFGRSALGPSGAQVEPRIVKLSPTHKSRCRDTPWNVWTSNVFEFTRHVFQGCDDLLLAAFTHSAALERRSRKLVVISRTIHENDDLFFPARTLLRILCRWLFHLFISLRLLDRVKEKPWSDGNKVRVAQSSLGDVGARISGS